MEREQEKPGTKERIAANKKPYTKPHCASEPIYETLALACGKLPAQGGQCRGAPHRS